MKYTPKMQAKLLTSTGFLSTDAREKFLPYVQFSRGVYSARKFSVFGQVTEAKIISTIKRKLREAEKYLVPEPDPFVDPTEDELN